MIGYLQGVVKQIGAKQLLVLTSGGVGYTVFPAGSLLAEAKLGETIEFYTHLIVREQEMTLYAFGTFEEQTFFEKIITVSGVGPKMGLQILSQPMNEWLAAVESGEIDYITRTPGVGKKMAQKIILELKGKLDLSDTAVKASSNQMEAVEALKSLGYDQGTVQAVLAQAPDGEDTEGLVKFFLSHA